MLHLVKHITIVYMVKSVTIVSRLLWKGFIVTNLTIKTIVIYLTKCNLSQTIVIYLTILTIDTDLTVYV